MPVGTPDRNVGPPTMLSACVVLWPAAGWIIRTVTCGREFLIGVSIMFFRQAGPTSDVTGPTTVRVAGTPSVGGGGMSETWQDSSAIIRDSVVLSSVLGILRYRFRRYRFMRPTKNRGRGSFRRRFSQCIPLLWSPRWCCLRTRLRPQFRI